MRKIRMLPTGVNSHRCRCLSALIILLLSAASLCQAQTSRFAAAYYNRGNERLKKGDLDGAIADYDAALIFDSRWALAYNMPGSARYNKGNLDGSITDYTTAIKIKPQLSSALNNRGNARRDSQKKANSETCTIQAIRGRHCSPIADGTIY